MQGFHLLSAKQPHPERSDAFPKSIPFDILLSLRSNIIRMNRKFTILTALTASLFAAPFAIAQAPAATAPAAPAAIPAKIALVNFEQVVLASNEGQTVTLATQKKYEPRRAELEKLSGEVETLKKAIQALPANATDEERTSKLRAADLKEKELNTHAQEAQEAYNTEWQEALGKVAQKIAATMKTYAQTNGYTILLDVSSQSSNVLWAVPQTDISQAIVDAYNKASGIAAPPPPAPRAPAAPAAPKK
jgi:outer membrane protein